MKIVINSEHGGFNLSREAVFEYAKRKGVQLYIEYDVYHNIYLYHTRPDYRELPQAEQFKQVFKDFPRNDPDLIAVVEGLGAKANSTYSSLKVVEIPDDVDWVIKEYDGKEWVAEAHRTWS